MTNIIAAITVLLATNYTEIGTFTDRSGGRFKVEEAWLSTNTYADFFYEGSEYHLILKRQPGPVIGERKTPKPDDWLMSITNNVMPFWTYTNIIAH